MAESTYSYELLSLVNKYRKSNGKKKLKPMKELDKIAYQRVKETAINYSHTRSNGKVAHTIVKSYGLSYSHFCENLGFGNSTSNQVFNEWICLPINKPNILNDNYKYVGSAYYY